MQMHEFPFTSDDILECLTCGSVFAVFEKSKYKRLFCPNCLNPVYPKQSDSSNELICVRCGKYAAKYDSLVCHSCELEINCCSIGKLKLQRHIYDFIKENEPVTVMDIAREFNISTTWVYKLMSDLTKRYGLVKIAKMLNEESKWMHYYYISEERMREFRMKKLLQ